MLRPLVLLLLPLPLSATDAVLRCETGDGQVTYTDAAQCPPSSRPTRTIIVTEPARSEPVTGTPSATPSRTPTIARASRAAGAAASRREGRRERCERVRQETATKREQSRRTLGIEQLRAWDAEVWEACKGV